MSHITVIFTVKNFQPHTKWEQQMSIISKKLIGREIKHPYTRFRFFERYESSEM
jgi:hypothetical protein